MNRLDGRRLVVGSLGGAMVGRLLADIAGVPPWIGGVLGAAGPILRATGAASRVPGNARKVAELAVLITSAPGDAVARAMYPEGLTLLSPAEEQ